MSDICIGIDGGGSRCRVAICDRSGAVLGEAEGGPANVSTDFDGALGVVGETLDRAAKAAGVPQTRLTTAPTWLGLAGAIDDGTCARAAEAVPLARPTVSDDRPTTMAGALAGADGCLVAAGTGSFLGRQKGGQQMFAGGWGMVLSDEASGAWLGKMLLARALAAHDGFCVQTPLLRTVLDDLEGPGGIARFSLRAGPASFARLAPRVTGAPKDPAARSILKAGADWISRGLEALGWQPGEAVCLTGGVGPAYAPFLRDDMAEGVIKARGSALDGAVWLARKAAGWV